MHIQVLPKYLGEIPYLEVCPGDQVNQALPLIIYYHGWTNCKEEALTDAYCLAQKGMRVLLPDQYLHGQRSQSLQGTELWSIVAKNLEEFPQLIQAYQKPGLIREDQIGVAGYSMGGITTYALLRHYPNISAAGALMGNPDPVSFSQWILKSAWLADYPQAGAAIGDLQVQLASLDSLSLGRHPQALAARPLYIWHGREDQWVPYDLDKLFYDQNKNLAHGAGMVWQESPGVGHKVPFAIKEEMAKFFEKVWIQ